MEVEAENIKRHAKMIEERTTTHQRKCSHLLLLSVRACLHQASASTLRQLCDDASNSVLIENNGVTSEWGCNPTLERLHFQ